MSRLTSMMVLTLSGLFYLSSCGASDDPPETGDSAVPTTVADMIEQQMEKAEDVEIKDKKSLNKNERIANTYINGIDAVATAMSKVTDEASAQQAVKVMTDFGETLDELSKELDGEGANRERAIAVAMASRQPEMMAVQQRIAAQMMRIQTQHPELMQTLSVGMTAMSP